MITAQVTLFVLTLALSAFNVWFASRTVKQMKALSAKVARASKKQEPIALEKRLDELQRMRFGASMKKRTDRER